MNRILVALSLVLLAHHVAAVPMTFTGDVQLDFAHVQGDVGVEGAWYPDTSNEITQRQLNFDPTVGEGDGETRDVGLPTGIDGFSGWDMRAVFIDFDRDTDTLSIGIHCYVICGDADGNGNPGAAGSVLQASGGVDQPNMEETETFVFMMDNLNTADDQVFQPTIAAGWSTEYNSTAEYNIYHFDPTFKLVPQIGLGEPLEGNFLNSNYKYPSNDAGPLNYLTEDIGDIEFQINGFTQLPNFPPLDLEVDTFYFKFACFAGSLDDGGVGEDFIPISNLAYRHKVVGCEEDECGYCIDHADYNLGFDECGNCPYDELYESQWTAECGCESIDECGLCESDLYYNNGHDECGICNGPGEDECGFCPFEEEYMMDSCYGCDDMPNSGLVYNDCGVCGAPDGDCPCYFDEYKDYKVWDLDRIILYYNTYVVLWDVLWLKDDIEVTLENIYLYNYDGEFSSIDWMGWCMSVHEFHVYCIGEFIDVWTDFVWAIEQELAGYYWFFISDDPYYYYE